MGRTVHHPEMSPEPPAKLQRMLEKPCLPASLSELGDSVAIETGAWAMMARFGGLVGLWLAFAGDTPAQATVIQLDCKVGERMNSYFQPTRIKVDLDTDSGIAEIRDDLTAKVTNGPVKGKIETFNDIRLTILWRVKSLPRDPKLSYSPTTANELTQRLTVRQGGSATLVSLTAGQYMNNLREFRAEAVCTTTN